MAKRKGKKKQLSIFIIVPILIIVILLISYFSSTNNFSFKSQAAKPAITKSLNKVNYIIGSQNAQPNEFPFIVGLIIKNLQITPRYKSFYSTTPTPIYNIKDIIFCTGSLISKNYVITAYHCVNNLKEDDFRVVINLYDIENVTPSSDQIVKVKEIIKLNRNILLSNYQQDIALIKLDRDINQINYLKLSNKQKNNLNQATVVGWGITNVNNSNSVPRYLQKGDINLDIPNNNAILASSSNNQVIICHGDSGAPLIYNDNGSWYLYGIASQNRDCNFIMRFTYVGDKYIKWISSKIIQ